MSLDLTARVAFPGSGSISPRVLIGWTILAGNVLVACELAAQVGIPRPTVARATEIFEAFPERVSVGTNVVFRQSQTGRARRLVRTGLQARVFGLRDDEEVPQPITAFGDCDVYLSVVHRLTVSANSDVPFAKMDHAWLTLSNSLNSIKDGRYFIVFELAGPDASQFRLKTADAEAYFASGFRMVVVDDGRTTREAVYAEYMKRLRRLALLYEEVDRRSPGVPCYSYRELAGKSAGEARGVRASLEPCAHEDVTGVVSVQ